MTEVIGLDIERSVFYTIYKEYAGTGNRTEAYR